MGVAMTHTG